LDFPQLAHNKKRSDADASDRFLFEAKFLGKLQKSQIFPLWALALLSSKASGLGNWIGRGHAWCHKLPKHWWAKAFTVNQKCNFHPEKDGHVSKFRY
jgi:hypothetical protein